MAIITIGNDDIKNAARILVLAFQDDPLFNYVFQSREKYERVAPWLFSAWIKLCINYGTAWQNSSCNGVLLMRPQSNFNLSLQDIISSGMMLLPFKMGWPVFRRFYFTIFLLLKNKQSQITQNKPHWYGWMIGVHPTNAGLGNELLSHCFGLVNATSTPLYIETTSEKNVSLYCRKNFELKGEVVVKPEILTLYFMVKHPDDV